MNENNIPSDETPESPALLSEPQAQAPSPASSAEQTSPTPEKASPESDKFPLPAGTPELPAPIIQAEPAPTPAPPAQPVSVVTTYKPTTHPLTRRELLAWVSATALITLLMAILLTLGVLSAINGGLSYITPTQFTSLNRQVDGLNSQAKTLGADLDGLRTRLDTLQGLTGRVDTVEKNSQALHSQLDDSAKQVAQLQSSLTTLNQSVLDLQKNGQSFQIFLDGLRKLLNGSTQP